MDKKLSYFRFKWVLLNELAIGTAPLKQKHILKLREEGIKSLFSLCSNKEVNLVSNINHFFNHRSLVLPDHKSGRAPSSFEMKSALEIIFELREYGPVFVHCVAAMERSPLVCMAWLIKEKKLSPQQALDYMMQINPGTNPLPSQFKVLKSLFG